MFKFNGGFQPKIKMAFFLKTLIFINYIIHLTKWDENRCFVMHRGFFHARGGFISMVSHILE